MQRNRLEVFGYISAKPALRYLPSGTPVANVRLGESYLYQDFGAYENLPSRARLE
jgi:primosomal replication protein N